MSKSAYLHKNKMDETINASEVALKERYNTFYCPTQNCPAKMRLDGYTTEHPHFTTINGPCHINNCPEDKRNRRNANYKTIPNSFKPENFFNSLFQDGDLLEWPAVNPKAQEKPEQNKKHKQKGPLPPTLASYYRALEKYNVDDILGEGDVMVKAFLADRRTNFYYSWGIFGVHIVECQFSAALSHDNEFHFVYPIKDTSNQHQSKSIHQWDIHITIKNPTLQNSLWGTLNNCGNSPIVIIGDWATKDNQCNCDFTTLRQIHIPKNVKKDQ